MKIRNSFVSNSSSSSFVVLCRKADYSEEAKPTMRLDQAAIDKLQEYGFKFSLIGNPILVGTKLEVKQPFEKFDVYDNVYLTYDVVCNQDFVILFLLENKIPFLASCHYDEEIVLWDGTSDYFVTMPNILTEAIENIGSVFNVDSTNRIIKTNIEKWLESERKIWKNAD